MSETGTIKAKISLPADESVAPPASMWRRWEPTVLGAGSIALLLLAWEAAPHIFTMSAGTKLFSTAGRRFFLSYGTPLAAGGILTLALFMRGVIDPIPAMVTLHVWGVPQHAVPRALLRMGLDRRPVQRLAPTLM